MFKKGDRVQLSKKAIEWGVIRSVRLAIRRKESPPHVTGIVASAPKSLDTVRVLRDGYKTPESYHITFWEKI